MKIISSKKTILNRGIYKSYIFNYIGSSPRNNRRSHFRYNKPTTLLSKAANKKLNDVFSTGDIFNQIGLGYGFIEGLIILNPSYELLNISYKDRDFIEEVCQLMRKKYLVSNS